MSFVLMLGFLSLSAVAVFVTLRFRSLERKPPRFAPIYGDNVLQFSERLMP